MLLYDVLSMGVDFTNSGYHVSFLKPHNQHGTIVQIMVQIRMNFQVMNWPGPELRSYSQPSEVQRSTLNIVRSLV